MSRTPTIKIVSADFEPAYFTCSVCRQLLETKPVRCPCCGAISAYAPASSDYVEGWMRHHARTSASRQPQNDTEDLETDDGALYSPHAQPQLSSPSEEPFETDPDEEDVSSGEEEEEYEEKALPPPEKVKVKSLYAIKAVDVVRIPSHDDALDMVLGGGFPEHRCLMFSGQPGGGKSTLIRQAIAAIAGQGIKSMYVSGEESDTKVRLEFKRLGLFTKYPQARKYLKFASATDPEGIVDAANAAGVAFLAFDSLGKARSRRAKGAPGKETQVVHAATVFQAAAHAINQYEGEPRMTIALITHATKGGDMAGANAAKHETDGAFMMEVIDPITRQPVNDPNIKTGHMRLRVHGKYREGDDTLHGFYRMTPTGLVAYDPEDEDPGDGDGIRAEAEALVKRVSRRSPKARSTRTSSPKKRG